MSLSDAKENSAHPRVVEILPPQSEWGESVVQVSGHAFADLPGLKRPAGFTQRLIVTSAQTRNTHPVPGIGGGRSGGIFCFLDGRDIAYVGCRILDADGTFLLDQHPEIEE